MNSGGWILDSLGRDKVSKAETEIARRRLHSALGVDGSQDLTDRELRFISNGLELRVLELLGGEHPDDLRAAAADAFQASRVLPRSDAPVEAAQALVRLGCLAVLGDRGADLRRLLLDGAFPSLPLDSSDWGERVWATILDVWLRLFRKDGWTDLDAVQHRIAGLRRAQSEKEPTFLESAEASQDPRPAWALVANYHLAKAAEIIGTYHSQGSVDGNYDIREKLEAQFDRAISAASRSEQIEPEVLARLLAPTAQALADNSIWSVTRAVNSRVTKFVESMVSREHHAPIFEMLPPQRRTLREKGLLGSSRRSVVVSLPTSGEKTLIAVFRILQALNQFDYERGWVAYLAPTRALVNQLTLRLRQDLGRIGDVVEKVSPALEIDGREADLLTEDDASLQFRVLVTTPEKLHLMLRGGWEEKIGRPLSLVVVDEAHGLGASARGLNLELLLATVNRECRNAQFLLLTPFISNGQEVARWLASDSYENIDLSVDWVPNDRVVVISQPSKSSVRGSFTLRLLPQHTTRNTLEIPEALELADERPLGLSWSKVSSSPGKLAAATAEVLRRRGTVIVLVDKPGNTWGVARELASNQDPLLTGSDEISQVRSFLAHEMGHDFPLTELLERGIGVHHSGLSDDTRTIVEWLTERSKLRALVATTTIAQGVNFPVSGVVFASHQYPYGEDMPPEDFWNIAGRAGRVDQGDLGIVALAGCDSERTENLKRFIGRAVGSLNSTLISMVQDVAATGELLSLEQLAWQPRWSAFLQYLAHSYRQIGDHERFAQEIEEVLRGTLGFRKLRSPEHQDWADQLVRGVYRYAERIKGQPLQLVDATGFSWESVNRTLGRLSNERIPKAAWTPELFTGHRDELRRMMGVLLEVPELRKQLAEVTGGPVPNGDRLARIICDWVQGRPLSEMARDHFQESTTTGNVEDPVRAMTKCCQSIFGRLTQTASWGLSALQALTLGEALDRLPLAESQTIRNLPARVYYGVNSDEAVALRILGVPRSAAEPLARELGIRATEPLHRLRSSLRDLDEKQWKAALGESGPTYRFAWSIIEGEV